MKSIRIVELNKITNQPINQIMTTYTLENEDHTLGNLLTTQLTRQPHVEFAGYNQPDPLEKTIVICIRTDDKTTPDKQLLQACGVIHDCFVDIQEQVFQQLGIE